MYAVPDLDAPALEIPLFLSPRSLWLPVSRPGQAADHLLAQLWGAHHPDRPYAPGAGRLHGAGS